MNIFYRNHGKRLFDLAVAVVAIVTLSPILLLLAAAVRVALGSPVLFRQARAGRDGRLFTLVKFRTMLASEGSDGQSLTDEERLTRFGEWLRSTSLDELPELWNVLRGEMSLVGPRPLLPEYLPLYSPKQGRRHEAAPGLTGLAQVRGRNALSWDDRFQLDVEYVDSHSLRRDVAILAATVLCVLRRTGVHADNHTTMPPFEGSRRLETANLRASA